MGANVVKFTYYGTMAQLRDEYQRRHLLSRYEDGAVASGDLGMVRDLDILDQCPDQGCEEWAFEFAESRAEKYGPAVAVPFDSGSKIRNRPKGARWWAVVAVCPC